MTGGATSPVLEVPAAPSAGAPGAPGAAPALLASEEAAVEQTIDRDRRARFLRSTIEVPLETGALVLVRKRSATPGGGARGAVLLCHGFAQNRYAWHLSRRSLSCYLAAEGFDVFNLDLRGLGRSRERGAPLARGFHDHVEADLPRAVDAALAASGERDVFLVGHSMGGAISCAFAGRAPEKVRGIVTIAGLYDFARRSRLLRALAGLAGALEGAGLVRSLVPRVVPTDAVGRILRFTRGVWDHPLSTLLPVQGWAPGSLERAVLDESMRRSFEPASREITLALARMARGAPFADARGRPYFPAFEARRDVPLLVIAGAADQLVAPEDARAAYDRSHAADKTYRLYDGGGEGAAFGHVDIVMGRDAPSQVWPVIRGWMAAR